MSKTATKPTAADAAAAEPSGETAYATPFVDLADYDEIVVEVGPRYGMKNKKPIEIEPAREVVMTKAGYQAMDRTEDGEDTLHIPTKLLGTPLYRDVKDKTVPGGIRTDMTVVPFNEADFDAETESGDNETNQDQA